MLTTLLTCVIAVPQGLPESSPHGTAADRYAVIGRVAAEDAPNVDGYLDDPCWLVAPSIGDFVQVEPVEGLVPGQSTVVKILHDDANIYMFFRCHDDDPASMRATQQSRDAQLDPDDRFEWIFDPFGNQNQGYFFQIGAAGSIGDALVSPGSFTKSWDTIWDGRARVLDDGWQAEVAIPFRSMAFPDGESAWRFNIRRIRRSTNEDYRWANARQSSSFFRLAELGTLDGIGEVDHGLGVDVVPYVTYTRRRQRLSDDDWADDPDAGGEVFLRLTPSLHAVFTAFTDFAQTESDARQINLTRFPLFFEEKRDFFLQDTSRFQFASGRTTLLPFFSRRIGLGPGGEIPIEAGAKVAGQAGDWGIGFLGVSTGEGGGNDFGRELGVLRLNYSAAEETRVGLIGTQGRPVQRGSNSVGGVDLFHRVPEFIGDTDLRVWAYAVQSQTSDVGGDGAAAGIRAEVNGAEWSVSSSTDWIGEEFNAELGFVPRTGIKRFDNVVIWNPRTSLAPIRNWWVELEANAVLDEGNTVQDLEFELIPFGFRTHYEDSFRVFVEREFERIDRPFTIFDDIVVPAGDYWEKRGGAAFGLSEGRPVSASVWSAFGDFLTGNGWESSVELAWRTGRFLELGAAYDQTRADVFGRTFTSRIVEGRADVHLTPRLSIRNLVQYDNDSRNLGVQSRSRWILEPGQDLYLVLTAGWLRGDDGTLRPDTQQVALKAQYTVRF